MNNEERIQLINSIEKLFYDHAFTVFREKHPGITNKINGYIADDDLYLLKYYNTYTKSWLSYLGEDELQKLLSDKINSGHSFKSSMGNGV